MIVSHEEFDITLTSTGSLSTGDWNSGEPYVVAPDGITVSEISPEWQQVVIAGSTVNAGESVGVDDGATHDINGAMVDPVPNTTHGLYGQINPGGATNYDAAKNVALDLPLFIPAGSCLVVSKGSGTGYTNYMESIFGLHVLAAAPDAGSIRPGLYGEDHTVLFNESEIDYDVLENVAHTPSALTYAEILAMVPARPWFEWDRDFTGKYWLANKNTACFVGATPSNYGREIGNKWGEVILWLMTDKGTSEQKAEILRRVVQVGLDIWSYCTNTEGAKFTATGGHKYGRFGPVVIAAIALNSETLKTFLATENIFYEDQLTFFVTPELVGAPVHNGYPWLEADVGLAEWGQTAYYDHQNDDRRWTSDGTPYRPVFITAAGVLLAVRMMGKEEFWPHPSNFAYIERVYNHPDGGFAGNPGFTVEMWEEYYGTLPPISPPPPTWLPDTGTLESGALVTMVVPDGMTGYYTTNGSEPTDASTEYTGAISHNASTTYKGILYTATEGQLPSLVSSKTIVCDASGAPSPVSNFTVTQS